jgi:hypothetical protein
VSASIGPYPSRVAGRSSRPRRVKTGTVTNTFAITPRPVGDLAIGDLAVDD